MLADFVEWYRQHGPNPLVTAMIGGGLAYGGTRLAANPILETGKSLAYPVVSRIEGGEQKLAEKVERFKDNGGAHKLGLLAGAGTTLALAALMYNPRQTGLGGLTGWNNPYDLVGRHKVIKTAALNINYNNLMNERDSIVSNINWHQPVNAGRATALINNDPYLQQTPYICNLGSSIINNAAINQQTRTPTLGGIFDSAVDKISKKLTFGNVMKAGLRTVTANAAARLFTGAVGTMCNLSPATQKSLISAGTWAGAIKSILD